MAADRTFRPSALSPRSTPLLVGRAREQGILREELAGALSGHGRLALLGGEAGIGKTSLARDLVRDAVEHDACILTGHCYDLTNTPPYGPWIDLVAGYQPRGSLPQPPATFASGKLDRPTDRAALFAEVQRFLADIAAEEPAVVVLEDLHWADPASVELLRYIAPHLRAWPILLLATYRVDELTRHHPLYQQLPAFVREAEGLRIDLRRLDTDALHSLVDARYSLPAADEERLVDYLEQHAEGNPLFATEILRALQEEGLLRCEGDRWSLGELGRVVVPQLLRQVIDGRVSRHGEEIRRPLAIAAVIGQEVPLHVWAAVAELDEEALLAIVERAAEAHLLEAERDGTRVRFVHALTREALYEGILPPRRRLLHRRVAEALAAEARAAPDEVAFHFQEAGDPRAWEWLERAGERAQRAYAWLTASERLRTAADLLSGVKGQERAQSWLLFRTSRLMRLSDVEGAFEALAEAERLVEATNDRVLAAEIQHSRGVLFIYSDRCRAGVEEVAAAVAACVSLSLEDAQAPPAIQAWLADSLPAAESIDTTSDATSAALLHARGHHYRTGTLPWFLALSGQPDTAVAIGEPFVSILTDVPGVRGVYLTALGHAFHGLGIAYAALGRPDASRQAFARGRVMLGEVDHYGVLGFALLGELRDVALTYDAADPSRRRHLSAEAEAALARAGGALRPGISPRLAWLGCLVIDGRWDEALAILRNLPPPGNSYLRREMTCSHATLSRFRGEPDAAWAQILPLFPEGAATEPGDIFHQEGLLLQRLAADLCLDAGDYAEARRWLEGHDRWLAWSGSLLGRADGRLAWARWHIAAGEMDGARAADADALTLAAAPDQPLVRLAAHRLLGEIETASEQHAAADAHFTAALDLADACQAPFERAQTLLALAELRAATGSHESAALLDEVRRICLLLGAAPTLARADAIAGQCPPTPAPTYPAGLTQREVDVLRLLVQHLTDKEIAEALFISPYTASTHVKHVLTKLGVESRREAAAFAAGHGLA